MGVVDLIKAMRLEALRRFEEERKKRKEFLKMRIVSFPPKTGGSKVERNNRLL